MLVEGIQVVAHGSEEELGVLGNDSEPSTERREGHFRDVEPVNHDRARFRLQESEESQC